MFKRMLAAFGVGGPSVDTVLRTAEVLPGELITGEVRIQGGSANATVDQIVLSFVTSVKNSEGYVNHVEFQRTAVAQRTEVAAGQLVTVPFQIPVPWESPINVVGGVKLPGITLGVRTELVISGAPDKGDLDPLMVRPLPSQDRVLEAFGQLGFQFRKADVEHGRIHGVPQQFPFFQEIEFYPPEQFAGRVNEVELTFVTDAHGIHVVLEADKRGGLFRASGDAYGRFHMSHIDAERADWAAYINQWLSQIAGQNGHHGHGMFSNSHHGSSHYQSGGHGPGMGGMVAGAAAGVVGGMVLGEVFDEVLDFGDDGGE